MLDTILEKLKNLMQSRLIPVAVIYFLLFSILIYRIFQLQVVEGEKYAEQSEKQYEVTTELKSTRGNIYDRNGEVLATNELSYSVTIENDGTLTSSEELNSMIHRLVKIIESKGDSINYEFPIKIDKKGKIRFTEEGNAILRFKKDVFSLNSVNNLTDEQINMTAEEVFDFLRGDTGSSSPKFNIDDSYSDEDALKIMKVRYALFMNRYNRYSSDYTPATIATDVSEATVAAIKENSDILPGVEISEQIQRVYQESEYFAQILGYTGTISSETLAEYEEKGDDYYSATDQIGKTGLESTYEEYLRGTKGYQKVTKDETNKIVDIKERVEPQAGNDVYLTIDANLQKACYKILERKLAGILISNIVNGTSTGSKGTSASNIKIPIYDVYYALIDNNIIDIDSLNDKHASTLEKNVYQKFESGQNSVLSKLDHYMAASNTAANKDAGDEMEDYLDYVYTFMVNNDIIIASHVDTEDATLKKYKSGKISLSALLQYAISQHSGQDEGNWIDLSLLNIGDNYYSTEELYTKLWDYTRNLLQEDVRFNKMIYNKLVHSYKISGKEICLLLFEQGVLEYDEGEVADLENGVISPYSFIIKKIKALQITPAMLALEPCSGSVVVVDVKTGDTLACVTYPGYDNNKMANTIDTDYYSKLVNDKSFPLINRPTKQKTAPGSTFKPITSIAGLEEGVISSGSTIHDDVVFEKINKPYPHCWSSSSHGMLDVPNALEVSCNYFFYEVGYRLGQQNGMYNSAKGVKTITKYAKEFGLGKKSGIELSEDEPHLSDEDAVRTAIGQASNSYTPVQIARYVSTIANEGTCYNLTILDKITDVSGKVIKNNKATVLNKVKIKQSSWDQVHEGMYKVVNGSDSSIDYLFKKLKVKVAGKTGTAQISKSHPNHALFVSFAPYDDPDISVTVVMPNGYTSSNAVEAARDIYKYYYKKSNKEAVYEGEVTGPEASQGNID
ncbi:MAG: penicillin-binding transpeptidase domain-containing protein [Clostridiales bacterium]|nr:penicillin-binding transpeptidase domain-containing protein [Clostridiales bacterium]